MKLRSRLRFLSHVTVLALLPLLMGSYYSCGRVQIGFYPNYPWLTLAQWNNAVARARNSHIHGTVLYLTWPVFYDTDPNTCHLNETFLRDYVHTFMDTWVNQDNLSLNLNLVFAVHGNNDKLGPPCIQYKPLVTAQAEFKRFYDIVHEEMSRPAYNDSIGESGAYFIVTIGNEIDLHLHTQVAWDTFIQYFFMPMRDYVRTKPGTVLVPWVGSNIRWSAIYDSVTDTYTANIGNAINVFKASNVISLNYYPVDGQFAALSPRRPLIDVPVMVSLSRFLSTLPDAVSLPVYLQEVGYPSHPALHGVHPGNPAYSQQTGEAAQADFVTNLFTALRDGAGVMYGAYWWSLYDFGADENSLACTNLAMLWPNSLVQFRQFICTMGLARSDATSKPAWARFVRGARDAETW